MSENKGRAIPMKLMSVLYGTVEKQNDDLQTLYKVLQDDPNAFSGGELFPVFVHMINESRSDLVSLMDYTTGLENDSLAFNEDLSLFDDVASSSGSEDQDPSEVNQEFSKSEIVLEEEVFDDVDNSSVLEDEPVVKTNTKGDKLSELESHEEEVEAAEANIEIEVSDDDLHVADEIDKRIEDNAAKMAQALDLPTSGNSSLKPSAGFVDNFTIPAAVEFDDGILF